MQCKKPFVRVISILYLFDTSPIMIGEIKGQVTEACLSSLLNQVIQDSTFYLANSEQPDGTPIRTVSVGVHRSSPQAIPISQPIADSSPR